MSIDQGICSFSHFFTYQKFLEQLLGARNDAGCRRHGREEGAVPERVTPTAWRSRGSSARRSPTRGKHGGAVPRVPLGRASSARQGALPREGTPAVRQGQRGRRVQRPRAGRGQRGGSGVKSAVCRRRGDIIALSHSTWPRGTSVLGDEGCQGDSLSLVML